MTTQAIQDYVKVIFKLTQRGEPALTSAIAEKLGVSAASATNMVKKLNRSGLADYHAYHGATLTEEGRHLALQLIRRHRLIEAYLHEALGFTWDEVDAEAERLEHHISERMGARMAAALGEPTTDPHGDPIPTADGYLPDVRYAPLATIEAGCRVKVRRVSDRDPAMLRYIGEIGLYPAAEAEIVARAPFNGPLTVRVAGAEHALGLEVAGAIFVEPLAEPLPEEAAS